MPDVVWTPTRAAYVVLLFVLFVVPRLLQRAGVPTALTALAFGAAAGMGLHVFQQDTTVQLLSTLGIVALFLFAGLDVDLRELRRERRTLVEHVVVTGAALALTAIAGRLLLHPSFRITLLVALALLTPSTGFILDSLANWGLSPTEQFWVRSKAIANELIALLVLFVALQSTSATRLGLSTLALAAMMAVLPTVFRWFASAIVPYAPKSEFGFLMMLAALCALVTRALGVYFLVGAFVVGLIAREFRDLIPGLGSERMLGAVEAFASLFVPFYFFHAGLELTPESFGWRALTFGALAVVVGLPLRIGIIALHRRQRLNEDFRTSVRVAVPLLPTTVFTLVIASLLRDDFGASPTVFGGLIVYAVVNTMVPGFAMRRAGPGFEDALRDAAPSPDPAETIVPS